MGKTLAGFTHFRIIGTKTLKSTNTLLSVTLYNDDDDDCLHFKNRKPFKLLFSEPDTATYFSIAVLTIIESCVTLVRNGGAIKK